VRAVQLIAKLQCDGQRYDYLRTESRCGGVLSPKPTGRRFGTDSTVTQTSKDARVETTVTAMLAEYSTLRQELLESIGHRIQIMNFTFAAMSVMIAGLLTRHVPDILAGLISFLAVPQFAHAGLLIWLGEYRRTERASAWVAGLEKRINAELGDKVLLRWESRSEDASLSDFGHLVYPYVATSALLLGSAYVALVLGGYLLTDGLEHLFKTHHWYIAVWPLVLYALVTEGTYVWYYRRRWQEARQRRGSQKMVTS
jgi:hypothetical protein